MKKFFPVLFLLAGCPTDFFVHVDYDAGTATVKPVGGQSGLGTGGVAGSPQGGAGVGANPAGQGGTASANQASTGFSVGIQPWFIDSWTGEKLFNSPGVWNSTFLSQLAPFSTIRHMDANAINCSKQVSWSTRRKTTDPQVAYGAPDGDGSPGIAIEYQVDMCNQTGNDCWFNIPHLADDDYVTQFATLVKSRLRSDLKAYVEYSNETWNDSFCQAAYVEDQGVKLGLPGPNKWYQGQVYTVQQLLRIGRLWPEARLVYAFSGNFDTAAQALKTVDASKIYMLAIAPYIDGDPYSLAGFKSRVDQWMTGNTDSIPHARRIADANGIKVLGCYEAGGSYYQNAQVYAAASDAGDAYTYMLDRFSTALNGPCNLYAHASIWNSSTAWGLYSSTGAKSARALRVEQWISSHSL